MGMSSHFLILKIFCMSDVFMYAFFITMRANCVLKIPNLLILTDLKLFNKIKIVLKFQVVGYRT